MDTLTSSSSSFAKLGMLPKLEEIAKKLDAKGYHVLKFIDDIMSDGRSLFYVDFGFDLGDAGREGSDTAIKQFEDFKNAALAKV